MAGKQAVPNGAYLLCDKGAKPGKLTVTPSGVSYYGESSATEFDALPVLNVPDFGACIILKKCVPITALWQGVVENGVTIGRGRPLKEDSVLPCTVGGTVRIFLSLQAATAAATAAASNHAAAEEAKAEAKEAKELSQVLFWGAVALVVVAGVAATICTGGAAGPLAAVAGEALLTSMAAGAAAGAVAGGVAGGVEGYNTGGLEGAAEGVLPGAASGALMGGAGGVVVASGAGAYLLPSVAAFGYGVYQDTRVLYYEPSTASGLVVFSDVVTVIAAAKTDAAVRRGLAPEPAAAPPLAPPRLVATPHPTTAMTNAEKGIYGEHVSDVYMANRGHTKINDGGRITQVGDAPRGPGIDGAWRNPNPPPEFIITDAKYGSSQPKMTADGKQMSENWVKGSNRLERATGLRQSQEIEDAMTRNSVERQIHQIGTDGSVTVKVLDAQGNVTSTAPPVQP